MRVRTRGEEGAIFEGEEAPVKASRLDCPEN